MIRVGVCDDEIRICEDIKNRIENVCPDCEVSCFTTGEELLRQEKKPDMVFLDIGIGEENGLKVAKSLQQYPGLLLIFVTAYPEHVFEAFDVGAFHYLLKPLDDEKFEEVLRRGIDQIEHRRERQPLQIKEGNVTRLIPLEAIYYAESQGRKLLLHTAEGDIEFYGKMQELEQRLGQDFFRCHRGYLVHLMQVCSYDSANIYLKNGGHAYLAKQKYGKFTAAYMAYLRRSAWQG